MMRDEAIRWYERSNWPYAADRKMVNEYAALFRKVKWQLFCTFTFGKALAKPVADDLANSLFSEFINRLEASVKADVIYIRGDEKRFSGCGKPGCGRHYHVVMTSAASLDPVLVEVLWKHVAGHRDDGADVQPYDPKRGGVNYLLKMMNLPYGEWTPRKLDLVFPVSAEMLNCRKRRRFRRHAARVKHFASAPSPKIMPGGPGPILHVSPLSGCFPTPPY